MKEVWCIVLLMLCLAESLHGLQISGRLQADTVIVNMYDEVERRSYLKLIRPGDGFEQIRQSYNITDWISGDNGAAFWGMTANYIAQKVFWNEFERETLYEYDAKSGGTKAVAKYVTSGLESLAYDGVTNVLYWTDTRLNAIFAMDRTYRYVTRVKQAGLLKPHALAIHTTKRKLIFSKHFLTLQTIHLSQIVKCDLDGKREKVVLAFPEVVAVSGITVDYQGDRLMWVDQSLDDEGVVQSSDMNGRSREILYSSKSSIFSSISRYQDVFIVTDAQKRAKSLYKLHIAGSQSKKLTSSVNTELQPRDVASYYEDERNATSIPNECAKKNCKHICLASSKGRSTCSCHIGYRLVKNRRCVTERMKEDYFIVLDKGKGRLYQVSLSDDGKKKVSMKAYPTEGTTPADITAFAIDEFSGDVLYYDARNGAFTVWNKIQVPFVVDADGGNGVEYMQVDPCKKVLYWNSESAIYKWQITKESPSVVYKRDRESIKIRRFALESNTRTVYWTQYDELLDTGIVMQLDYKNNELKELYRTPQELHAISIDYDYTKELTNTLTVATKSSGVITTLELEAMPSDLKDIVKYSEDLTKYVDHITSIQDLAFAKGLMFIVDRRWPSLLRLKWKFGKSGIHYVKKYGRDMFFHPTMISYYGRPKSSFDQGNRKCRPTPTQSPTSPVTNPTQPISTSTRTGLTVEPIATSAEPSNTKAALTEIKNIRTEIASTETYRSTNPLSTAPIIPASATTTPLPTAPTTTAVLFTPPITPLPTAPTTTAVLFTPPITPLPTAPRTIARLTTLRTTKITQPITSQNAPIDPCQLIFQIPGTIEEKQNAFRLCKLFAR